MPSNSLQKIMIVEDERIIASDLALMVENLGYKVSAVVDNGEQALKAAKAETPDLTLMDIVLPGMMDGIETATKLRTMYQMPVVFITAYADNETVTRAKKAEPHGYILKPFEEREIQTTLEIALFKADAERRIKEQEALLSAVLHSIDTGVIAVDQSNVIRHINPVASRLTGWSETEAIGMHIAEVLKLRHDKSEVLYKLLATPAFSPVVTELVMRSRTGMEFDIACSIKSVEEGSTIASGHVITFRDITERKQAEAALRESEERFRTTFYSLGEGVITTDLNGTIVRLNHNAESLTGWQENEARGKHIDEVFRLARGDREGFADNLVRQVITNGQPATQSDRMLLVARDESRYPVLQTITPLRNSRGEVNGTVIVFSDQRAQRELEEKFLQAQKMEAVGRLAGGIAHDFNNMLGVVIGYAGMMEENMSEEDPNRRFVQTLLSAADRSAALTRQLLAFARHQAAAPITFNLNRSLQAIEKLLPRVIGENVTMRIVPAKDLWNVKIDPTQVDQILTNLAANARDAIANIGTITIETYNTIIDQQYMETHLEFVPGEYVVLVFSDTGSGMDKATREKIFEPYFTTKPKGKGTGLGLATVFGIVKQNNGYIHVYSEQGLGTTFKIYLPRDAAEVSTPSKAESKLSLRGTETVLIVEDEVQLLELATATLTQRGYTVLSAATPLAAIQLASDGEKKINLMVTDIVMPEMNGKELRDKIEALRPGLPVIFMSGYTADTIARHGILEDGVQFLAKPFTPTDLAKKVREVLDAESHRSMGSKPG